MDRRGKWPVCGATILVFLPDDEASVNVTEFYTVPYVPVPAIQRTPVYPGRSPTDRAHKADEQQHLQTRCHFPVCKSQRAGPPDACSLGWVTHTCTVVVLAFAPRSSVRANGERRIALAGGDRQRPHPRPADGHRLAPTRPTTPNPAGAGRGRRAWGAGGHQESAATTAKNHSKSLPAAGSSP